MDNKHFDFNLLKVLEALYQEQNMTQAAKLLHISPSAVSHAMKRLRDSIQDPLFVRQGQQMIPTATCRRIAPLLFENLNDIRRILNDSVEFTPKTSQQQFKIAIHDAIEGQFLPKLIFLMHQQAPNAELLSFSLNREQMINQLATGEIDLAIDVARSLKAPIVHTQLVTDPFCVIMSQEHTEASVEMTEDIYLKAEHINVSSRAKGSVIEDRIFQQIGINRRIKHRCQSYQTAVKIVSQSNLLLTAPISIAQGLSNIPVIVKHLPILLPETATHLYWHQNTENNQALYWLRGQIKQLSI
ncbi:LysR family transcriptional regulator [Shewanella maritima]|uniref:LysR family transcriptional regulator n=1 Tax=Shewanella maritima TaxID=2520507 RepID=UPI0037366905